MNQQPSDNKTLALLSEPQPPRSVPATQRSFSPIFELSLHDHNLHSRNSIMFTKSVHRHNITWQNTQSCSCGTSCYSGCQIQIWTRGVKKEALLSAPVTASIVCFANVYALTSLFTASPNSRLLNNKSLLAKDSHKDLSPWNFNIKNRINIELYAISISTEGEVRVRRAGGSRGEFTLFTRFILLCDVGYWTLQCH